MTGPKRTFSYAPSTRCGYSPIPIAAIRKARSGRSSTARSLVSGSRRWWQSMHGRPRFPRGRLPTRAVRSTRATASCRTCQRLVLGTSSMKHQFSGSCHFVSLSTRNARSSPAFARATFTSGRRGRALTPAYRVEHGCDRQRQVAWREAESIGHAELHRVQPDRSVRMNHALGIAGGAGGVAHRCDRSLVHPRPRECIGLPRQ